MSRYSQGGSGDQFGGLEVASQLFADVLLATSEVGLWHTFECFAAECKAAGRKITSEENSHRKGLALG